MDTKETCEVCGKEIKTMAFKRTGVCGELHRKVRDKEENVHRPLVSAPAPVLRAPSKIGNTGQVPRVRG